MLVLARSHNTSFIIDQKLMVKVVAIMEYDFSVDFSLTHLKDDQKPKFFFNIAVDKEVLITDEISIRLLNIKTRFNKRFLPYCVALVGIDAPKEMKILRSELIEKDKTIWKTFPTRKELTHKIA